MQVSGAISDLLVAPPPSSGYNQRSSQFLDSKSSFLSPYGAAINKGPASFYIGKLGIGVNKSNSRRFTVRASDNLNENFPSIAPLQLESPPGQLLMQILQTHPHLVPAAIDQQLENLQNERDAQKEENPSAAPNLLYKRIAQVKEKERRQALEEIIYSLIILKFVENSISMIPEISRSSDPTGRVDFWPNQEQQLESVHSPEALEMIQSHLSLVIGERLVGPLQTTAEISKVKLGKLYAASIMYGYFLRRVDRRFQLERAMKTLPEDFGRNAFMFKDKKAPRNPLWDPESLIQIPSDEDDNIGGGYADYVNGDDESQTLRTYVMYLDPETLQSCATIRSREAMSLIERQTQALFGRPDIQVKGDGSLETQNDEIISISFAGMTMLILEAVTFGSFLWDAEDYVESKCSFVVNS